MRATVMYGAGDIRVVTVPDARMREPTAAVMPSVLTLSDVMGTGYHAALAARVAPGQTAAVIGDGAVGLCGVIAADAMLMAMRITRPGGAVGRVGVPHYAGIPEARPSFYACSTASPTWTTCRTGIAR